MLKINEYYTKVDNLEKQKRMQYMYIHVQVYIKVINNKFHLFKLFFTF